VVHVLDPEAELCHLPSLQGPWPLILETLPFFVCSSALASELGPCRPSSVGSWEKTICQAMRLLLRLSAPE